MSSLRALILGAGGREHALALHLLRSDRVEHVYVAPGNGGTAVMGDRCSNVTSPKASGDFSAIAQWAVENNVNLVVPGPEAPLVEGVEFAFRKVGIPVFGPSPVAAQMEGSKKFAKEFMDRHNIPTAAFRSFTASQVDECMRFIAELGGAKSVVLKASGLAGGKGVLLPETEEEAKEGVEDLLVKKVFGDAGDALVVEERLDGSELSVLAFSDGYTVRALPGCQDHKRIGEGDTGLNTGGMGAYCPTPDGTAPGMEERIRNEVLLPTIAGMRKDGYPFVGMLFVGLMLTSKGPKVLEYNVRFGDPETEAVLELLQPAGALTDILMACVERRLDCAEFSILPGYAVSVVIASGGYPGKYATGVPMTIDTLPKGVTVYHAGTRLENDQLVTAGGRVVVVSATGETLEEALQLLSLPREVGVDPADGEVITAQNGRYGPYLKKGSDSRSLASEDQIFSITLDEARRIYAEPKRRGRAAAKPPLKMLGDNDVSGKPMSIKDGRFGPYVTDGETNASLQRGDTPETMTDQRANELLSARRAREAEDGGKKATKKAAKKKATKKATKPKKTTKRVVKARKR